VLELDSDGRILCFGGAASSVVDPVPKYHNDLRQLDTETMIWTKPDVVGVDAPSGRYGLCSAHVDNVIVICGGWGLNGNQTDNSQMKGAGSCFSLRLGHSPSSTNSSWIRPSSTNPIVNRYGHTMTAVGSKLFVFGGWNGKQACNDLVEVQLR
jgi:N-acetylneuraminic acid mutarotase